MHKNVLLDWIAAAEERHFLENAAAQRPAAGLEIEMLAASNATERSFWRRFTNWPTAAGRTAPRGIEPKTELR
jgi:hypothetical protein